jgi:N-acetylneuraminate lyase
MARAAAEAGCHAIAAIPPHGGKYSYEELTGYYRALAAATPLPLFVYHIPEVSGYDYSREHLSRWLEMPNVLGMKFTSFDLFRLERLAALHPDKVIFSGADQMLAQGLASGARGAIGSTYNLAGPLAIRIHSAVRNNDIAAAMALQGRLNRFIECFQTEGRLRGFKALAAGRFGWTSARSPAPGITPEASTLKSMRQTLEAALQLDPVAAA